MRTAKQQVIYGSVLNNGTIVSGSGFTARRNGTGDYTLTFPPGVRVIGVVANTTTNSWGLVRVASNDGTNVSILAANPAGTVSQDQSFNFVAVLAV